MLNVYFRDYMDLKDPNIERNVEDLFEEVKVEGTELDRKIINLIEKGEYVDRYSYIDRFGYKLYFDDMSTGCKAALCVANLPDRVIDLVECGLNARDVILSLCKSGNVLISDNMMSINGYSDDISVCVDGKVFNNVKDLNKYLWNDRF